MKSHVDILAPISFLVILLILWQFMPGYFKLPSYILPTPIEIIKEVLSVKEVFLGNFVVTLQESLLGLAISIGIGLPLGIYLAESEVGRRIFLPYVIGSNAIPVIAVAPLLSLWLGQGIFAKSVIAAFLSFFPLTISTYRGLDEYDSSYEKLFQVWGANRYQFLTKFKLPHSLPSIFSGLKLSATYTAVGATVAEFIGATQGLGYGIIQSAYSLNTARLFGYIIVAFFLGLMLYGLIGAVERIRYVSKLT